MRADGWWDVEDTAAVVQRIGSLRTAGGSFDVAVPGESDAADSSRLGRYAEHEAAGATWWIEAINPWRYGCRDGGYWPLTAMRERIDAGP